MDINKLIEKGEAIYATRYLDDGYIRDRTGKMEWEKLCLVFLRATFPNHPDVTTFESLCANSRGSNDRADSCWQQISILKAFAAINPVAQTADYDSILINIFDKFQKVERQLARRREPEKRETLRINDEYDVQDLLHALLKLHFDDIRAEENSPSDAGSSKRLDFLLNDEQVVVEVKMTRDKLKDKEIGDQLKIDISSYKSHPKCKKIYCFVYDKDGFINNPRGIEKDLESLSTSEVTVRVFIRPE